MSDKKNFPFKTVTSNGEVVYRLTSVNEVEQLQVEPGSFDHLQIRFRKNYETPAGNKGNKYVKNWGWTFSSEEAVQFASLLMWLVDTQLRDWAERPDITVVADAQKASYGQNFVMEDMATAKSRMERRRGRSFMFGLMQRFIETCDNDKLMQLMASNLFNWAQIEGGGFEKQLADKMLAQLGIVIESDKRPVH